MIQPFELRLDLPVELAKGVISSTKKVWQVLLASKKGDLNQVKMLVDECPELIYAQYNYTPPIHFAVREGHLKLVKYLLENGAHDPDYKTYPFLDTLNTIAQDRDYYEIDTLLNEYCNDSSMWKYRGDNGNIQLKRTALEIEFQESVNTNNLKRTKEILSEHPEFATDASFFWWEGILMMPSKGFHSEMMELLINYGATIPDVIKWAQAYYFERFDAAGILLKNGMNPNVMSWHHVTILHDMAQKGNLLMVKLLINHGAKINVIEEEYQSTPLGLAVRWGHINVVEYLLDLGADVNLSGTSWSKPIEWAKKKGFSEIENILENASGYQRQN